jgi:hypothetical protein
VESVKSGASWAPLEYVEGERLCINFIVNLNKNIIFRGVHKLFDARDWPLKWPPVTKIANSEEVTIIY